MSCYQPNAGIGSGTIPWRGSTMRKYFATPQAALRYHVSGSIARREKGLDVPSQHALKLARATMRMRCVGARIMGGPNHVEAVETIRRLTGAIVAVDAGCTCKQPA